MRHDRKGQERHRYEIQPEAASVPGRGGERLRRDLRGIEVDRFPQALDLSRDRPISGVELAGADERPERLSLPAARGRGLRPVPVEGRALDARASQILIGGKSLRVVAGPGEVVRLLETGIGRHVRCRRRRSPRHARASEGEGEGQHYGAQGLHAHRLTVSAARAASSRSFSE